MTKLDPIQPWLDPDRTFAFMKGRVAFHAILEAAGVGPGDEVVMPGFTCVVVPAAVGYRGAKPVFHDIDPLTLNGNPTLAAKSITDQTRVVVVQHSFGMPADLGELIPICRERGILIVEDCAHSVGATTIDGPVGTLGDAAFCSFQWSKPVTTGLGGLALVNDPDLARAVNRVHSTYTEPSMISSLSLEALSWGYDTFFRPVVFWFARDAYRWASARGIVKGSSTTNELLRADMPAGYLMRYGTRREKALTRALQKLSGIIDHRREMASLYMKGLEDLHVSSWALPSGADPIYLRVPLLVKERDAFLEKARTLRIEMGDWFNAPLHPNECNASCFGYTAGDCPISDLMSRHIVNLPTHDKISAADVRKILKYLRTHEDAIILDPADLVASQVGDMKPSDPGFMPSR